MLSRTHHIIVCGGYVYKVTGAVKGASIYIHCTLYCVCAARVCVQCVYSVCTVCVQCVYSVCTVCVGCGGCTSPVLPHRGPSGEKEGAAAE